MSEVPPALNWTRFFRDLRWAVSREVTAFGVLSAGAVVAAAIFGFIPAMGALVLVTAFAVIALGVALRESVFGAPQPRAAETNGSPAGALSLPTAMAVLERLPDPFLLLDDTGRVAALSKASQAMVGAPALRRHISAVIRNPEVLEAVTRVLEGGGAEEVEYSFLVPVERHYRAYVGPVPGERGGASWVAILMHDLTAQVRVDQMRADFVANASHELRTPLASVSGFIETLRGHAKDDPAAREKFLEIMADQTGRMRRLINDLLSLSRIELNEHVPPSGELDLRGVVSDVIDGLTPLAAKQGVKLTLEAPETFPPVTGERDELFQVFQNLIDNAIKYGAAGKEVRVALGLAPARAPDGQGRLVFAAVRDWGRGIAREHLPRLTERFYRIDVKESRERGGTGLGLAIVKHILVRHRGWLSVESKPGEGSTFTVFLPAAGASEEPKPEAGAPGQDRPAAAG